MTRHPVDMHSDFGKDLISGSLPKRREKTRLRPPGIFNVVDSVNKYYHYDMAHSSMDQTPKPVRADSTTAQSRQPVGSRRSVTPSPTHQRHRRGQAPLAGTRLSGTTWGMVACRLALRSRTPFALYLAAWLKAALVVSEGDDVTPLPCWPCPVPYPEAVRPSPTSARHRRQHYWALARRRLVNLAVGALNFQAGECKSWMPVSQRTWRPLTSEQRRHVNQIERLVSRWGHTKVEDLSVGRKGEELAEFVQALQSHIHTLSLELGSYASSGRVVPGAPSKGFIPVDPARLAFPDALEGCRISEHLGPYLLAAYEEPLVLRSTVPREPTAAHPRFHGSKQQLVEVFRRWARVGRFGVIPAGRIPKSLLTQVSAVPKDIGEDRQILDERGVNSIEDQITEGPSKHLPSGFLLLDAHLQPSEQLILGAKDRKSFYHQFEVSDARMRRTPVGAPLYGADLATLDGCEGLGPRSKYLGCFRGLGMGDHIAVDVALEGHEALLQEYGALDDSTWVRGDRPVPGGDALVAVIIDDLLVATKAPRHAAPDALPRSSRRDLDIFALADAGYLAGGTPGGPREGQDWTV